MTKRQMAAMETRRKILDAAMAIIQEKGLSNTTVEEITRSCGVSTGTFYTYFDRKEDVVLVISRRVFAELYESTKGRDGPFIERLESFMVGFSRYIERSGVNLCQEWIRNTTGSDSPRGSDGIAKLSEDLDAVEGIIRDGVQRGELIEGTPSESLSRILVEALYGEMLCWAISDGGYSFEERTQCLCDDFLDGLMGPYMKGDDSDDNRNGGTERWCHHSSLRVRDFQDPGGRQHVQGGERGSGSRDQAHRHCCRLLQ